MDSATEKLGKLLFSTIAGDFRMPELGWSLRNRASNAVECSYRRRRNM
jgi:hypothetical protein